MSWNSIAIVLSALLAVTPSIGSAQRAASDARPAAAGAPDPADPKATVPPARYSSAFARYRPNADVEVGPWRETNDAVGRIGGWRVYGREAIEKPGPATGEAASPASPPAGATGAHRHQERR